MIAVDIRLVLIWTLMSSGTGYLATIGWNFVDTQTMLMRAVTVWEIVRQWRFHSVFFGVDYLVFWCCILVAFGQNSIWVTIYLVAIADINVIASVALAICHIQVNIAAVVVVCIHFVTGVMFMFIWLCLSVCVSALCSVHRKRFIVHFRPI